MPVLLVIWILLGCTVFGEEISLVPVTAHWSFFKGTSEPSAGTLDWTRPDYNADNWLLSNGGVSSVDTFAETTQLADYGSTNYTTVYFRKSFQIQNSSNVLQLTLRIDYDDGFVAYLNGKEVARRGLTNPPATFESVTNYAAYHPRGYTEAIDISAGLPNLLPGTNIFAIQLLGSGPTDLTACMVAQLLANFSRAPYVQNTTSNSTQIIWKTLQPTDGSIELGTNQETATLIGVDSQKTNHVGTLTNLQAGTTYSYRVRAKYPSGEAVSDWKQFRTFKTSGWVRFEVIGDSGWATPGQLAIARHLADWKDEDLVFHVGDVVYFGFSNFAADFRYFGIYEQQLERTPFFFAWGNHDNYGDLKALMDSMYLPTNSVTGTEHWYSFDEGDVHFTALWLDHQAGVDYSPGSAEYNWLEQDLANTSKPWKFLFFHHTWRSSSIHGGLDDYNSNGVLDSVEIENSIAQLANRYGVQIIFNGHDHDYERLTPRGGTMSFVTGGGGAQLYHLYAAHPDTVFYKSTFNFLKVEVGTEETFIQAVDDTGVVFDSVHVRKTYPDPVTYNSEWHTPQVQAQPANDNDGNIIGQKFDFSGTPIGGKTAPFSSAGRLFINNDAQNLYFGIDETALRSDQNLFLFLEAPAASANAATSSMAGLGNGIVDPEGEGVDGLDCLENLSFTNFAPNIAVILGDELADAPFRSWKRPLMDLPIGQGAYVLTNGFPSISGTRLQQFNLSPETYPVPWEQNANFIKISIPFSSLGGIGPGDPIKVALVVGLAGVDTNLQTREIDLGGVAAGVSTNNGIVWVEGLNVQLAHDPDTNFNLTISNNSSGQTTIRWPSIPGRIYQLQSVTNLLNPWQDVSDPTFPKTATGNTESATVPNGTAKFRFYRLVQLP